MHRLFVAIRPPRAIRSQLLALGHPLPGARWQDEEQLHLTLRFIGEVDRHRAEDVAAALGHVRAPAPALTLGRLGVFDHRGRPNALWIGVGPQPPLEHLHNKINQALLRVGLEPERRAFVPHITLARLGRDAPPLGPLIGAGAQIADPWFTASDFCLYESELGRDGSIYTIVARYPLDPVSAAASSASAMPR